MDLDILNKNCVPKDVEQRRKLAVFLKRKRIENHMTLEELAKGVCTVSYLSRIENNVVDVGDDYFVLLFNKLDIDYNTLKESKNELVFDDILKSYLKKDIKESIRITTDAIKTNYYVDLEYDLMVLYNNIMMDNYTEAKNQIISINTKIDTLLDKELYFYLFNSALYCFKTEQGLWAAEQIDVLLTKLKPIGICREAALDLALDIYFFSGMIPSFYHYYDELMNDSFSSMYHEAALHHQAQRTYIEMGRFNKDETFSKLSEIKLYLVDDDKDFIDWIFIKTFYYYGEKESILLLCKTMSDYVKACFILGTLALTEQNPEYFTTFLELRKKIVYKSHESMYKSFNDSVSNVIANENYQDAYSTFKLIVKNNSNIIGDCFIKTIIENLFIELCLKNGKFKEAIKFCLELRRL